MRALVERFARDESAATSIEYALIGSGIGLAIVLTVVSLGTALAGKYTTIVTAVK